MPDLRSILALAILVVGACKQPAPIGSDAVAPPTGSDIATPPPTKHEPSSSSSLPEGRCNTDADCNGGECEGEGCGPGEGVCAAPDRMCTRDLRPYCGCDGQTFRSSGSCPGDRFSHRGEC